ncbi:MAG: phage minor capsid protein, partial [Oscillospiraceae bacterium]
KDGDYGISNYCGKKFMLLSAAIRGGLFHPNCRHTLSQYIDGVTQIPKPIPAEKIRQQRELEQKQRSMERKIRKLKRFSEGTLDPDTAQEYRRKLRQAQHELKLFVEEHNDVLHRDYSREKYYGGTVDKPEESGIIKVESDDVALEYQRYGRNKNTLVNKTYIESGEYRRKFDNITDNENVNKALYDNAKKALKHRSGTLYEDMYWFDNESGKIIAKETNSLYEQKIVYSEATKKAVSFYSSGKLIAMHSHPSSMPPSIADFNSCCRNGYAKGIVICHNGKVFVYTSEQEIREDLYSLYVSSYISDGMSEYDAQLNAINKLKDNHMIDFMEVTLNGDGSSIE